MKFSYKLNNLLGTVYKKGNLIFTPDGNSVISPVGNRITIFNLRNNKSTTLPIESRYNYEAVGLSPDGFTLLTVNEVGEANIISLISQTVVYRYQFKRKVRAVKFSPDGKHFAVCKENNVFVFKAPNSKNIQYNGFVMERVFHGAYDETTCLDWSSDSKILAVGSKDMATKLYPLDKWKNFRLCSLGSHTEGIVGCFFEEGSYDITTISRNGQLCIWESTVEPQDLIPLNEIPVNKKKKKNDDDEDDVNIADSIERTEEETVAALEQLEVNDTNNKENKMFYKRVAKHFVADEVRKNNRDALLTSAAYHKTLKILVTGYSTGEFFIHELPDVNQIHSLSISDEKIKSISLNDTGDWIALGCGGSGFLQFSGQLLVWEWQSETYIMKQQGHSSNMSCISYSGDGQMIVTGGEDGKVKLWNIHSGFCFVTFTEHTNAVSDVAISGAKRFVVSASYDGTVRTYDLKRYRNFRTFTSTKPVQFSCVSVDSSGEFVAAGGQDVFEICLWSVKTGRLLEVLAGHEGPVSSLTFSPIISNTTLVSVSWDKTLKTWDAIEKGSAHEAIELIADGTCVAYKPDGQEVAVATLDGQISVFHIKTAAQLYSIEGRNDLGSGRSDTDLITAKKTLQAKCFTSLCYSADGEYLLAGGHSKNVCIYYVKEALLLKKFEITQNHSLDAVDDFINRRKLTEFGNIALVEEREEKEGGKVQIKLPGVRKGDMASRVFKPEVRVYSLQFAPTGQHWAAATTEGLLVYSLNAGLVFDPWQLRIGITPEAVRNATREGNHIEALAMAMKLNEAALIQETIEKIPVKDIELVILDLTEDYIKRLILIISGFIDNSRHLEYYICWAQQILTLHLPKINVQQNLPALLSLEKSMIRKYEQLSKICDHNKYTLRYIERLGSLKKEIKQEEKMETESENESNADSDFETSQDV
ncbi:unnamed protein product [Acanthoscelides obtectus]|uniref:Small-subunit processome Utp12 domain-containing protein n=1 Tax=Acanthoscelides obtectus TaxID=200917 RepID=A0A9P0KXS1_ACAOB|nr:unnamed protein product [Acanthoscelides obtectus]CAK1678270.1 Periodic tryptophan protein 2 homolog [Acanthoscelides obtectus]